jgi:hypothetical protein
MYQDDSEKRIEDPEQLEPLQPRWKWFPVLVATLSLWVVTLCGALLVLYGAVVAYENRGTPTTATIDQCVPHVVGQNLEGHQEADYETCYGRWSVGGVSQTGPIGGRFHGDHPIGSHMDVHVRGGHAYTPPGASLYVMMFVGLFLVVTGLVLYWSARRKDKTGSWPWSRRRG